MTEHLIPEHRQALAVDFYCTVARSGMSDRGCIRLLAAEMFGIPLPYDKDRVDALVTYVATNIFTLAGIQRPSSAGEMQQVLTDLVNAHHSSTVLLDKTA